MLYIVEYYCLVKTLFVLLDVIFDIIICFKLGVERDPMRQGGDGIR